jgi:hypothetical protein
VNGLAAAERALREGARPVAERRVLVLAVWKAGVGFELLTARAAEGLAPAPINIRAVLEIDETQYENGRWLASKGAGSPATRNRCGGCRRRRRPRYPGSRHGLRVARKRGSCAVVVGERAHGRLGEVCLGNTSRDVIRYAPVRSPSSSGSITGWRWQ